MVRISASKSFQCAVCRPPEIPRSFAQSRTFRTGRARTPVLRALSCQRRRCGVRRQQTQIGFDAILAAEENVVRDGVKLVDVLIRAVLFHNENRDAQLVYLIQLLRAQLGEMLCNKLHDDYRPSPSAHAASCSRPVPARKTLPSTSFAPGQLGASLLTAKYMTNVLKTR